MDQSLQERLHARLEAAPDGRAITFYQSDRSHRWVSYGDFYRRAGAMASRLIDHGLETGDVCIVVLPSGELSADLLMATLLAGGLPLMAAPPMIQGASSDLPRILRETVRRTGARVVVCAEGMEGDLEDLAAEMPRTRLLFGGAELEGGDLGALRPARPGREDLVAMQLTSGTTGFPRICVWKQRAMLAALDGMVQAMDLGPEDVCLNWTPLYHDMGLVNNFFTCISSGIPLVMLSPQEFMRRPALWLQGLHDTGANVTWSPNFGFAVAAQRVTEKQMEAVDLSHVEGFWNAAERIHLSSMRAFYGRFASYGVAYRALKTNFGCAENIGGATFSDPHGEFLYEYVDQETLHDEHRAERVPEGTPGSVAVVGCGPTHPLAEAAILSPEGEPLPDGEVGELALETPSRMEGYLADEEATRQAITGPYLRTGDLAYMRDGEVFWVGRVRERITSRGKKLDPSDLEPILFPIEGLRTGCFAAFGVDDPRQGTQKIVVVSEVVEPLPRQPAEIASEVRRKCFQRLGITLSDVVLVPRGLLVKTSSGKRRHRHFRNLYQQGTLEEHRIRDETELSPREP